MMIQNHTGRKIACFFLFLICWAVLWLTPPVVAAAAADSSPRVAIDDTVLPNPSLQAYFQEYINWCALNSRNRVRCCVIFNTNNNRVIYCEVILKYYPAANSFSGSGIRFSNAPTGAVPVSDSSPAPDGLLFNSQETDTVNLLINADTKQASIVFADHKAATMNLTCFYRVLYGCYLSENNFAPAPAIYAISLQKITDTPPSRMD